MDRKKFEEFVEKRIARWADRAGRLQYDASTVDTVSDNRYFSEIALVAERCSEVAGLLRDLSGAPIAQWREGRRKIAQAIEETEQGFEALESALGARALAERARPEPKPTE